MPRSKRMGMGPKNAELYTEDGSVYVRIYNDKTGWYHTWNIENADARDVDESLSGVEVEIDQMTEADSIAEPVDARSTEEDWGTRI